MPYHPHGGPRRRRFILAQQRMRRTIARKKKHQQMIAAQKKQKPHGSYVPVLRVQHHQSDNYSQSSFPDSGYQIPRNDNVAQVGFGPPDITFISEPLPTPQVVRYYGPPNIQVDVPPLPTPEFTAPDYSSQINYGPPDIDIQLPPLQTPQLVQDYSGQIDFTPPDINVQLPELQTPDFSQFDYSRYINYGPPDLNLQLPEFTTPDFSPNPPQTYVPSYYDRLSYKPSYAPASPYGYGYVDGVNSFYSQPLYKWYYNNQVYYFQRPYWYYG